MRSQVLQIDQPHPLDNLEKQKQEEKNPSAIARYAWTHGTQTRITRQAANLLDNADYQGEALLERARHSQAMSPYIIDDSDEYIMWWVLGYTNQVLINTGEIPNIQEINFEELINTLNNSSNDISSESKKAMPKNEPFYNENY